MKISKPPSSEFIPNIPSIFLAGSIENGTAENWQDYVSTKLADVDGIIYNPRRDDWNWSWEQSIDNPVFKEQVQWELSRLGLVDIILMYFDPNTKSPISLLELGLHARTSNMIVCCPKGFWRKGNVDIVCERFRIKQVETLDELVETAKQSLNNIWK